MNEVKYFEREYNFLQVAGEEFGRKFPGIGKMLNLDDRQRKDPFVERLYEAFAFLSGRIHERLDDDIPEFAGALLEQLFPQFLRPFPSCAILEAETMTGAITKPVPVTRGKEIQTRTGEHLIEFKVATATSDKRRTEEIRESVEFIYRTVQDFVVYPMKIKEVRLESTPDGNSALNIQFQLNKNVNFEVLNLKRLTLFLHGDNRLRYTLLLYLLKFTQRLEIKELTGNYDQHHLITPFRIYIPELESDFNAEEDKAILPYARQTFSGYRLLHEYFSFPEKFFFIDILGLEQFQASKDGYPFEIRISFNRPLSTEWRPKTENIRINCVPIVNLFQQQTEPLYVNRRMPEYYIIPDADRKKSREIYSINKVTGVDRNKKSHYKYTPITSYEMLDTRDPEYEFKRFYSTVFRPQTAEMNETYIRLFGPSLEQEDFPEEILSIDATLSNGFLPAKYLQIGQLNQPRKGFPEGIAINNLTVPSDVLPCPARSNYLWALLAHLTVSFTTLAATDTLKSILGLYNWSIQENNPNRKKISEGIVQVLPPVTRTIFQNRALIRGIEFKIEIDVHKFEYGEGDIHLFGMVLNRFLSQYITINSFAILTFVDVQTKRQYTWQPDPGKILAV